MPLATRLLLTLAATLLLALPAATAGAADLQWSQPQQVDSLGLAFVTAYDCPATWQCTAVDTNGHALTFNPDSVGDPPRTLVAPGFHITSLVCPSTTACVGGLSPLLPTGGPQPDVVTFNPQDPRAAKLVTITATGFDATSLSCPAATQCTAVAGGAVVTFDPHVSLAPTAKTLDNSDPLGAVDCPTATRCTAVGAGGGTWTFNPQSPSSPAPVHFVAGGIPGDFKTVTCPSANVCVALDSNGSMYAFDLSDLSNVDETARVAGFPGHTISCVSDSACYSSDNGGDLIAFDPGSYSPQTSPTGGTPFSVFCQTPSHCLAVGQPNLVGVIDPQAPSAPAFTTIDYGAGLAGLWCPAANACVSLDGALNVVTFDPAALANWSARPLPASPAGFTCLSATRCVEVDPSGRSFAFDPHGPAGASPAGVDTGHVPAGLACPSATLCVLADHDGGLVVYDPGAPGGASRTVPIGGEQLTGLVCPATTQCTVTGTHDTAATFDPRAPGGLTRFTLTGAIGGSLSCFSTSQCLYVESTFPGTRHTFDPRSGTQTAASVLSGAGFPIVSACRSTTDCLWTASDGTLLEDDPQAANTPAGVIQIPGLNISQAIACPAADLCVVADISGQVSVARPPQVERPGDPPPPVTPPSPPTTPTTPARPVTPPAATRPLTDAAVRSLLGRLLATDSLTPSFTAPAAGKLTIRWMTKVKKKTVTIASGTFTYKKASTKATKIKLRLTKAGRSLLKHHKKLKVTSKATFKIAGRRTITATRHFTLKR
jgi:hypothetical protein